MPDSAKTRIAVRPRIRVLRGSEIVMGPGKAELLTHIAETGSLSQAARHMKMSYMKAWLLVQVMNRSYKKPLVLAERGGTQGGGARLTMLRPPRPRWLPGDGAKELNGDEGALEKSAPVA